MIFCVPYRAYFEHFEHKRIEPSELEHRFFRAPIEPSEIKADCFSSISSTSALRAEKFSSEPSRISSERCSYPTLIHACMVMIRADYWARFSFKDRWTSYVLMMGYVFVLYVCLLGGYYLVWTTYLGFYQPMPLNWLVVANVAVFGIYPAVPLR